MHLASVVAADAVLFTAAAVTREQLLHALAEYAAERAPLQLWPAEAAVVRERWSRGDHQGCVDLYFAAVGDRWDHEILIVTEVARSAEAERVYATTGG